MQVQALYIGNDMVLEIAGLTDEAGVYVNDAVITATLVDVAGANVSGVTWPVTLAYVAASDGVYRCVLDDALSLTEGANYIAEITATASGVKAYWETPFLAQMRTGT